jgi:transposase-like protein
MGSRKRKKYTTKQREAVLADVLTSGVIAAAKKHRVPQSCVSRWARDRRRLRALLRERAAGAPRAACAERRGGAGGFGRDVPPGGAPARAPRARDG